MKLNKKLSHKHFILAQLLILLVGLILLGILYYILNVQYQVSDRPFSNGPVTTAPKSLVLDLDQPDDNSLFFTPSILVTGKTAPLNDVLISANSQDQVIKSKKDGSFTTEINLDEGVNRIMAVVFDPTGNARSQERTVYYSKGQI